MKSVIVLGQARSGTSMCSGLFSILGVQFADEHPNQGNPQNIKGMFEHIDFAGLDREINDAQLVIEDRSILYRKFYPRALSAMAHYKKELWGFKSAMAHWHLEFWLGIVPNPFLVFVFRNPLALAESLQIHIKYHRKEEVNLHSCLGHVIASQSAMYAAMKYPHPKLLTSYERMKSDPCTELHKFAKFIDCELTDNHLNRAVDFIEPTHTTLRGL